MKILLSTKCGVNFGKRRGIDPFRIAGARKKILRHKRSQEASRRTQTKRGRYFTLGRNGKVPRTLLNKEKSGPNLRGLLTSRGEKIKRGAPLK